MLKSSTIQLPVAYDHSIRIGDPRRPSVVFVRVQEEFRVPEIASVDAPVVARYHVGIEEILLRRSAGRLVTATLKAKVGGSLHQGNPFPEFLMPGSVDGGRVAVEGRLSDDREACRRLVERETGQAIMVDGIVHRPTEGLVTFGMRRGVRRVATMEALRASRRPVVDVFDLADPCAPRCPGLEIVDPVLATGTWDRSSVVLKAACEDILRGLQADLMNVDTALVRRWTKVVSDLRSEGADEEMHRRCLDLLRAFVRKGAGRRASRLEIVSRPR